MLVLFSIVESKLLVQAGLEKAQRDLLQPPRIRYDSRSFSVRCLVSLAYRKGLIYAVTLSVVVPQAIGSFLHNRIGNHIGEFLVISFRGFYWHSMFLNCSDFSIFESGLGACLPSCVL